MTVDEQIANEVLMYVQYCKKATSHGPDEESCRAAAHKIFLHIQEMRQTGKTSSLVI